MVKKKKKNNKIKKIIGNYFNKNNDSFFSIIEVVVIILVSIIFGVIVGYLINYSRNNTTKDTNLSKIVTTYNDIVNKYYGNLDKESLSDAAVKGMIESLDDPYSNYLDKTESSDFSESLDGSFIGIGVEITDGEEYTTVVKVYENSPAEKAKVKVDDQIIKVDGKDVKNLPGSELAKLIKGKKNTKVIITVLRNGKEKEISITRDVIELESVTSSIMTYEDKDIGYIKISSFAANTYSQFYKALKALEVKKIDSLIIDVRDNPGGQLLQTKQILSLFFNDKTVLYQVQSNKVVEKIYSLSRESRKYPVAILINNSSASASEILASCFKENYKKSIVLGTNSFGKGTVQKTHSFKNGTTIKYTAEKWLTSKGKDINGKGVVPDVVIEQSEEYYEHPFYSTDVQLQEALKKIKESN